MSTIMEAPQGLLVVEHSIVPTAVQASQVLVVSSDDEEDAPPTQGDGIAPVDADMSDAELPYERGDLGLSDTEAVVPASAPARYVLASLCAMASGLN